MNSVRGGGKNTDKKNKAEKKQAATPKRSEIGQMQLEQKDKAESESDRSPAIQEYDNDVAIQMLEDHEVHRDVMKSASERNDVEVEQKMQSFLAIFRRMSG